MKTKTETQLEKEIDDMNFDENDESLLNDRGIKFCELNAKLSQHKTDIKNFEKLIKKMFYIKGHDQPIVSVNKVLNLKEALKEL